LSGEANAMNDTKALLQKIAALRVRLDQAQSLARPAVSEGQQAATLEDAVQQGAWHNTLLTDALPTAAIQDKPAGETPMPPRLTARGARVLKLGRELLHELRALADETVLPADPADPVTSLHFETSAMLDAVLRSMTNMSAGPGAQLRLCEGLEGILDAVRERLGILHAAIEQRRQEKQLLDGFADLLSSLAAGETVQPHGFQVLAEQIRSEAHRNQPLRFHQAPATDPARFAAAHCLTVTQVLARLLIHEADWRDNLEEALLAALVHDVGMARLPVDLLAQPEPLGDEQRRHLERHTAAGAQIVGRAFPGSTLAVQAALDHHERVDGTGYPAGKRDMQISSFVKLLAVCDVYAALCSHRPHRLAQETRTALTDVLLLADQGALDKFQAEKLLQLSFYPVGSVVELSDGAVAVVTTTQACPHQVIHPAKPTVALLQESQGRTLAMPKVVDLLNEDNRCILRALPAADRKRLLGKQYPALI
jgi:HD-GYP domain-containing protein (c-di-GMP phosphodiesterase class II)